MKWLKFTERECDLFTSYCILVGYTRYFRRYIGYNFKNFLVIYQNGIINSFRLKKEYDDFIVYLRKKRHKLLEVLLLLKRKNNLLQEYNRIKNFTHYSNSELINLFEEFYQIYQDYFSCFTLPKYFGLIVGKSELTKKEKNLLSKTRGRAVFEEIQDKFLSRLFKEIAKRNNLPKSYLWSAIPAEIITIMRGKYNKKLINVLKLRSTCLIVVKNGKKDLFIGDRAKNVIHSILKKDIMEYPSEISGVAAYKGKIYGRVKKVIYKKDLKNLKKKILVTPMTSVRFFPYLKGIKAIITDEGGISCHAAIIARELKIPCVIGTKIATQVLKDGDRVEVDATKGIVKKL